MNLGTTSNSSKAHVHTMNLSIEPDPLTTAFAKLYGKQDKMEECLVNLSKQISTLTETMHRAGSRRPKNCWYHGTDTHDITQFTVFQKLNRNDKIDTVHRS